MSTYTLILQTIASFTGVATSTSMIIAYRQLRLATRNSQMTFEDALAREYRQMANRVPVKALLGEGLDAAELSLLLPNFYWYFDLSNEQVFLRRHGRVSDLTWSNWADGIANNMGRPAFAQAWAEIQRRPTMAFADLRRFVADGFRADPIRWTNPAPSAAAPAQHQPQSPRTEPRRALTRDGSQENAAAA
ncbi:MAG: hypothetical protein H7Y88_11560 [Phycisphaerales bacterium]|nr:hypothetical protein [Phycisphaerales bacterium]